jgi:hypothetical protein
MHERRAKILQNPPASLTFHRGWLSVIDRTDTWAVGLGQAIVTKKQILFELSEFQSPLFQLSIQSVIQLLSALKICVYRENELFRKQGCPSIVPYLLFGEFANLEHLTDKCHSGNRAKSIEMRRYCDTPIAVRLRPHERRENPRLSAHQRIVSSMAVAS